MVIAGLIKICFLLDQEHLHSPVILFICFVSRFFFCGNFGALVYDLFQFSSFDFLQVGLFFLRHHLNYRSLCPFV